MLVGWRFGVCGCRSGSLHRLLGAWLGAENYLFILFVLARFFLPARAGRPCLHFEWHFGGG